MWRNIVEPERPQVTKRRMRIAYRIRKATSTHSEYVVPIAFPLQKWFQERVSVLRYKYITFLV